MLVVGKRSRASRRAVRDASAWVLASCLRVWSFGCIQEMCRWDCVPRARCSVGVAGGQNGHRWCASVSMGFIRVLVVPGVGTCTIPWERA